jgi:hypothetical protein
MSTEENASTADTYIIMLNTEDRIREKISIAILEYTEKINHLKAQLATFGN